MAAKTWTHDFLGLKIAVETSLGPGWGGAPLGSAIGKELEEVVVENKKEVEDARPSRGVQWAGPTRTNSFIYTCRVAVPSPSFHRFLSDSSADKSITFSLHFFVLQVKFFDGVVTHFDLVGSHKGSILVTAREIPFPVHRPIVLAQRLVVLDTHPNSSCEFRRTHESHSTTLSQVSFRGVDLAARPNRDIDVHRSVGLGLCRLSKTTDLVTLLVREDGVWQGGEQEHCLDKTSTHTSSFGILLFSELELLDVGIVRQLPSQCRRRVTIVDLDDLPVVQAIVAQHLGVIIEGSDHARVLLRLEEGDDLVSGGNTSDRLEFRLSSDE